MKPWCIVVLFWASSAVTAQSMLADIRTSVATEFGTYEPRLVTVKADAPSCEPGAQLEFVINLRDFQLSTAELTLLQKNHFYVTSANQESGTGGHNEMFDIYNECRESAIPQFITTDAMLHGFHLMFDRILKTCEEERFSAQLLQVLDELWAKTEEQYRTAQDQEVKRALFRNLDYLLVAILLLEDRMFLVDPLPGGHYSAELERIKKAEDFLVNSLIFEYPEDYTQYRPRGHYTRSEQLERYFRAMMWLGRMTFSCEINSPMAKTMTLSAILLNQAITRIENGMDLWQNIYQPTVFFVGKSDDINFPQYLPLCYDIYGKSFPILPPDAFADTQKLDQFLKAAEPFPAAEIGYPGQPKKGFRFMGQRFVPDSWILDQLVFAEVPDRWMPTGLDVMIVLGPEESAQRELAFRYLSDNDKNNLAYVAKLDTLKKIFHSYPDATWAQNAYWNWLYCLMPLQMVKDMGYPFFMRSSAWRDKELYAALASWSELRHDTILYVKQSGTERGLPPGAVEKQGYVEPNPHLYARLSSLAEFMITGLKSRDLLLQDFSTHLTLFAQLAEQLTVISEKELTGSPLSSAEYQTIFNFGKTLYDITTFQTAIPSEGPLPGASDDLEPMPVVADVHTDGNSGLVLEEGVGFPYAIYVVCCIEGVPTLTKGAGFSYFEFTWPAADRLTDEKWRQMLITGNAPTAPEWSRSFIHSASPAKKTEFFQWEKPRSIEITVDVPNQVQLGEDVPVYFAMNDDADVSTPTLTLITSAEKVIPISVERDPVRSGWRATIKTIELPLGLTYLRFENGAG
ncbi:MAG: DUF3160 domain-containing protein, partial [Calditrichaeota bacterium]